MSEPSIRPKVIAVVRRGDEILVFKWHDRARDETYYCPLGGGIEFGERGVEALRREMLEEIGLEVRSATYIGLLENIFRLEGRPAHELVLVYETVLADDERLRGSRVEGAREGEVPLEVSWMPLTFFQEKKAPLYPEGLLDMIRGRATPPLAI
jgi:8-oxo-dGTP pyrophosphatase MutT (NUDIX family)